ncbi:hypothetical protein COL87_01190 [Bacillus pseudomycoides]|uniref:Uncharacterized protein n=1 Tax=Bacillus pseudomycoides TaxID=64104 RepID=A0ABD6TBZ5_9BACI|nr:hypothetical protein COL29_12210 [Bacillus pseudomycoides]PGA76463.1 hypothetical protein COL87_01190 [Bacillus pseudomycoides]PGC41212.1 hypothetical protein COM18_11820 [Bacillus pseudomycoides]PHE92364.1 hypothetical protein COF78_17365 [Bacillus pseudomycoides]PHE99938.1 hypothetical protein COF81_09475 [Bacillus pseudomycoides]
MLANNGGDTLFYTVVASFNMASYGEVVNETFLHLENANKFAAEQKQDFFDRVRKESTNYYSGVVLDEDFSIHEENKRLFYFYGVTDDGDNVVTASVTESVFMDEPQAIITVPEPIS